MTKAQDIVNEANRLLENTATKGMVWVGDGYREIDKQVSAITAISKKLGWSRSALFGYILETCPDLRERLTNREIKHYKTSALYKLMNTEQKSLVIKRLDQIKKRNKGIINNQ